MIISKDDYEEPRCPLCMNTDKANIPISRVLEKLDEAFSKKDFDFAERLLDNWIAEAKAIGDNQGSLSLFNEKIGLYRKLNRKMECLAAIDSTLQMVEVLKLQNTLIGATSFINAATGYNAFELFDDAVSLYKRAENVLNNLPSCEDRLAALYNNMASALVGQKNYDEADNAYNNAIQLLEHQSNSATELAITYLNMADMITAQYGYENVEGKVNTYLDKAESLLDSVRQYDSYYAFVCEKCAPVFGYYGFFLTKNKFLKRAEDIYERT